MKSCTQCSSKNDDDSSFCNTCGEKLELPLDRDSIQEKLVFLIKSMGLPQTKSHSKLILISVIVLFVYIYSLPYLTIYQIKSAVHDKNSKKLKEVIDFPILRKNYNEYMISSIKEIMNGGGGLLGGLTVMFAKGALEVSSGDTITPESIMNSYTERTNTLTLDGSSFIFNDYETYYESFSKFVVRVRNKNDDIGVFLILTRYGLTWRLTEVNGISSAIVKVLWSHHMKTGSANNIAIPQLDQFNQHKTRAYDSDAKANLHNIYLACKAYWADNGSSSSCGLTEATETAYGFIRSHNVIVTAPSATETTFTAKAQHQNSRNVYTIDANGNIR